MAAKHILIGTDFSEQSKRAIESVHEYATTYGAKVTLAYVVDPRAFVPPQAVMMPETQGPHGEGRKADLDRLAAELLPDIATDSVVLVDHAPARAICEYAKENEIDAIAIGSYGHSGVEHWLIGSVAERIVRHAPCSVFVFRD